MFRGKFVEASFDGLPSLSKTSITLFIIAISSILIKTIYNRYFHPLRRVPGPFWASLTRLWWIRVAVSGKQHIVHVQCHEKYGQSLGLYYTTKCLYGNRQTT
jgi:hypothetical protein